MGEGCIIRGLQAVFCTSLSSIQNDRYRKMKSTSVQRVLLLFLKQKKRSSQ